MSAKIRLFVLLVLAGCLSHQSLALAGKPAKAATPTIFQACIHNTGNHELKLRVFGLPGDTKVIKTFGSWLRRGGAEDKPGGFMYNAGRTEAIIDITGAEWIFLSAETAKDGPITGFAMTTGPKALETSWYNTSTNRSQGFPAICKQMQKNAH